MTTTITEAIRTIRAAHDRDGAVLDLAARDAGERALELAISVPVSGVRGVHGRTPSGEVVSYPAARQSWFLAVRA